MVKAAEEWKPTPEDQKAFEDYKCAKSVDSPGDKPLVTCDRERTMKYLLSPVAITAPRSSVLIQASRRGSCPTWLT
ncbi:protein-export membrane protein SecD [Cutibacterium acnes JCM 18916]|nr:protein-export membrane protein SecD [Cutibacterium acnes JCM 18916]GAE74634.1 protein-export membrane protein SecD [Cutibacterium acnes JCM 18918]